MLAPGFRVVACLAFVCLVSACEREEPKASAGSRFASVKKEAGGGAGGFCERQWPAASSEARKYVEIPERPIPGAPAAPAAKGASWRWVNLWATWCLPCLEEMRLLGRWKSSLAKDGVPLDLELWSVDDDEAKLVEYLKTVDVPGRVRWLRGQDDLPAVLESLGADKSSAIPVHALVDAAGNLRCLRVGSVHDEDYGAVKALLE